jgi:hypothetical protein
VIGVGIGIVIVNLAITAVVVAMIDHHTVVVLPLDVTIVATTGLHHQDGEEVLLPEWVLMGVWDIQEAFRVISLEDCILVVTVVYVQKSAEEEGGETCVVMMDHRGCPY